MSYKNYQNARDVAWKILLDCKVDRLPVDLNPVCGRLKIRVLSYGRNRELIQRAGLTQAVRMTDGLTFYLRNTPVVLFDETVQPQRARFTVAHEVGHIVLGHVRPGGFTPVNREPQPGDAPEETEANQFAARLLAPACVLWGLDIHTPEEIMRLCHISGQAARFRAERMRELYRRRRFLTSPLEREVFGQFQPFMSEFRRSRREV